MAHERVGHYNDDPFEDCVTGQIPIPRELTNLQ